MVIHLHFEADTPQHPILFKVGIRWSSIYIFIQWAYSFIEKYSVTRHQSTLITEPRSSLNLGLVFHRGYVDLYLSILRDTAIVFIFRNDVATDVLFG